MTLEELKQKRYQINNEAELNLLSVAKEYAISNNSVKVGDIVTDHIGKVLVEEIKYGLRTNVPYCVYIGQELKKDGTPRKRTSTRAVYQSNLKR